MLTIGDFARHGRVSVRMLRHYDAVGLLRPAHVDQSSGYRFYKAVQLSRLNRIVALKDLGFTLQQVQAILDEDVSTEELRGMLRLRRAELEAALVETAAGLVQVEARLRSIENEGSMLAEDVIIRHLPAARLAELSGTAESFSPGDTGPLSLSDHRATGCVQFVSAECGTASWRALRHGPVLPSRQRRRGLSRSHIRA
jgi:DNA-binding transcriptional MerR regulator